MAKPKRGGKRGLSGGVPEEDREFHDTGERIDGIKVIEHNDPKNNAPIPQYSNTPNTKYILKKAGQYKSLGIYNEHRELVQTYDLAHSHTNKPKSGKKEMFKKGLAHVHNHKGGRENNVRKMTVKEIKKYGRAIRKMGGSTT